MRLVKFPRGRDHARSIDAVPVPDPQGPGHEYTEGIVRAPEQETPTLIAAPPAHDVAAAPEGLPLAAPPVSMPPAPAPVRTRASVQTRVPPPRPAPRIGPTPAPAPEAPAETDWTGWKVTDEFGRTVGKVESTEHPEWLVIRDRRGRHLLAPSYRAIGGGESVFLPYGADLIHAAPRLDGAGAPDEATAAAARAHYE